LKRTGASAALPSGQPWHHTPPSEMDRARILWAAGDIIENRPPLSRWHPEYRDAFRRATGG